MSPRARQRQETPSVPRPRETAPAPVTPVPEAAKEPTGRRLPIGVPHVGLPSAGSTTGRLLWLGGLGVFVALGALDWPVAVAVAAGTWVAEQRARERLRAEQAGREG